MNNNLIIITPTIYRPNRLSIFKRLGEILRQIDNFFWLVVEDGVELDLELKNYIKTVTSNFHYFEHYSQRYHYHDQINEALKYVKNNNLEGKVYIAEDSHLYEKELFDEIRKTNKIAVFPVGNVGPNGIERPIYVNDKILNWDSGWKERKFPVCRAGFSFDSNLLKTIEELPLWNFIGRGVGGESEFIERFIENVDDLEVLCDKATRCYVWANEPI